MKRTVFFSIALCAVLLLLTSCDKISIDQNLPDNAVILRQVIFINEVEQGTPQTIQLPNGTVVTYKMPKTLSDGQLIKVRDMKDEPPYYIRINLKKRTAQ